MMILTQSATILMTKTTSGKKNNAFFSPLEKKPTRGRNMDKKIKDLKDLLLEMRNRDDNGEFMPTCVARLLSNLPQSEDGNVQNSQILGTLQNIRKEFVTRRTLEASFSSLRASV